jgi:predicted phosphodiesterase
MASRARKDYDAKAELHDIVSKVQAYYREHSTAPTTRDLTKHYDISEYDVKCHGGMVQLLQHAGIEPGHHNQRKNKKNPFAVPSIADHIVSHEPREKRKRREKPYPRIAVISDIHWPFEHKPTVEKFLSIAVKAFQPEHVVINGDAWDFYSHSKFPRSHNVFTPGQEEQLAREMNATFWAEVQKAAPKAKCHQILGNHDIRPLKRIMESMPTMEHWVDKYFRELFTFENVETIFDPRQELILGDDIVILHGYASKLGDHRDHLHMNAVVGHTHRPGVVYKAIGPNQEPIWEANSGLAGDPTAKGLTYTTTRMNGWVNSFLMIDEHGPRVVHT